MGRAQSSYQPRQVETSVLHVVIREHLGEVVAVTQEILARLGLPDAREDPGRRCP